MTGQVSIPILEIQNKEVVLNRKLGRKRREWRIVEQLRASTVTIEGGSNLLKLRTLIQVGTNMKTAYSLVDSGASHMYMAEKFAKERGLEVISTGKRARFLLADTKPDQNHTIERKQVKTRVEMKDNYGKALNFDVVFEVVNLGVYDVILGKPWLEQFKPEIDYKKNMVRIVQGKTKFVFTGLVEQQKNEIKQEKEEKENQKIRREIQPTV